MNAKVLLGRRIKNLRQANRITQEELAEKMGISAKYLSSIERGHENPTLDTLIKLANALGVELEEVFTISHEASDPKKLREVMNHLLMDTDEQKLRLIVKIIRGVLH